jgi:hypothetical protein
LERNGLKIAIAEGVLHDPFRRCEPYWPSEIGPVIHKAVELAILPAGVDIGGQVSKEIIVDETSHKTGVKDPEIDAGCHRPESSSDKVRCEPARIAAPNGVERPHAVTRHKRVSIGANVLQKQVAER